ncbi:hypothetical protein MY9_0774 [Bacillus sp. JS]|nr:hypothetical protein MY9_0774 [Bacillus sp. JS]
MTQRLPSFSVRYVIFYQSQILKTIRKEEFSFSSWQKHSKPLFQKPLMKIKKQKHGNTMNRSYVKENGRCQSRN